MLARRLDASPCTSLAAGFLDPLSQAAQQLPPLPARVVRLGRDGFEQNLPLHYLASIWPHLPDHIRATILTLAEGTRARPDEES